LIDFGASEVVPEGEFAQIRIGTDIFTAPERKTRQCTIAADVFSLGATFCYFIEGDGSFNMEGGWWALAPGSLRNLIAGMMEPSDENRPTVEACIGHPFFREVLDDCLLGEEFAHHDSFDRH
jgi:serine/threonine protein kinase